jgi:sugar phosphate isomerase/epimerase
MFHLYDGWEDRAYDQHLPLGHGNLDLASFLRYVTNHPVTLEIHPPTLTNFIASHRYLQQLQLASTPRYHVHNAFSQPRSTQE